MNKENVMIRNFIAKIPLWGWIVGIIAFIFLINYASSLALNRSLFNMTLDNLRKDQSQILQEKDEQLKVVRDQSRLYQIQIREIQKEKEAIKLRADQSALEVQRLKGENNVLYQQLQNVTVSNNPDRIIDDLNKAGFKSIRRRGANKP